MATYEHVYMFISYGYEQKWHVWIRLKWSKSSKGAQLILQIFVMDSLR